MRDRHYPELHFRCSISFLLLEQGAVIAGNWLFARGVRSGVLVFSILGRTGSLAACPFGPFPFVGAALLPFAYMHYKNLNYL